MSPLRGWRAFASDSRGLRPWLNYVAAPRLERITIDLMCARLW